MLPLFIGLTGKKRSGKDSFAQALVECHGFRRVAFADPLKNAVLDLDPLVRIEHDETGPLNRMTSEGFFRPGDYVRLSYLVDLVDWEGAKDVREVRRTLQRFGESIRALDLGFWVRQGISTAERHRDQGRPVVITDVRYLNELAAVKVAGGVHVHVDRPGLSNDDPHPSETVLEPYYEMADFTVHNDGTLDDLARQADEVVASLTRSH